MMTSFPMKIILWYPAWIVLDIFITQCIHVGTWLMTQCVGTNKMSSCWDLGLGHICNTAPVGTLVFVWMTSFWHPQGYVVWLWDAASRVRRYGSYIFKGVLALFLAANSYCREPFKASFGHTYMPLDIAKCIYYLSVKSRSSAAVRVGDGISSKQWGKIQDERDNRFLHSSGSAFSSWIPRCAGASGYSICVSSNTVAREVNIPARHCNSSTAKTDSTFFRNTNWWQAGVRSGVWHLHQATYFWETNLEANVFYLAMLCF